LDAINQSQAQLVLVFGSSSLLKNPDTLKTIRTNFPKAVIFGCSTAGEIASTQVTDNSLVLTAVEFEHTTLKCVSASIKNADESASVGENLASSLDQDGLAHVLVLSDGLCVNGTDLVKGLSSKLPSGVAITGGLSGDGERFQETWVIADGKASRNMVAVVGLYGNKLKVGYGSLGGWDSFGPERLITRSKGNVLYELDGQSALELYKKYLGEHAKGLPATGLLFPLNLRSAADASPVVRTILGVDENEKSMTFAGTMPQGAFARFMKANFDRLIDGASGAAKTSVSKIGDKDTELALLISCVGRKLILKQRVEEEVEGVREILGPSAVLTGFYSYGEISPFMPGAKCELHNQTMTITTFSEK
jgi:hypothetical protein